MELEERLLGEIFGLGGVGDHAQAEGVDAALVQGVEAGKGGVIALLGEDEGDIIVIGVGRGGNRAGGRCIARVGGRACAGLVERRGDLVGFLLLLACLVPIQDNSLRWSRT